MSRPWRRRCEAVDVPAFRAPPGASARRGALSGSRLRDVLRAHRLRHAGLRRARHGRDARLGNRRDRHGPVRLHRGADRRLAARPGPAHHAVADHRRRARHLAGSHQDRARRYRPHALWLGHLRQPLAGDRRRRHACWRRKRCARKLVEAWRASARSVGRRHRARSRCRARRRHRPRGPFADAGARRLSSDPPVQGRDHAGHHRERDL